MDGFIGVCIQATVRRDVKRGGGGGALQIEDKVPDKMELPDTLLQQPTTS